MLSISSSVTSYRYGGTEPLPLLTAYGYTGTVTWSVDIGSLSAVTGETVTLTPPNQTRLVNITAMDNLDVATFALQIFATFPVQPKWGIESDRDRPITRWPMAYEKRTFDEYWSIVQFFKWHQHAVLDISESDDEIVKIRITKGAPFFLYDLALDELALAYFDSPLRRVAQSANWINYSIQILTLNAAITSQILSEYGVAEYGESEYGG